MADMFGGGAGSPPPPPPPPRLDDKAVQQALAEARMRRHRARGLQSTILSQQLMSPGAPALKDTLGS